MDTIMKKIKSVDQKVDILFDDILVADVNRDGLLDKKEAAGMITGLLSGKGQLNDKTDFNTITQGGVYYLPKESNYINDPSADLKTLFGGNFRAKLTVIRNYGSNPNTDNPIVYQKWESTTLGGHDFYASRWFINGAWDSWSWPLGKPLFVGSSPVSQSNILLNQSVRDFGKIEISWKPLNQPVRTEMLAAGSESFIVQAINVANDASTSVNPAISFEELRMTISADGKTLTPSYDLVYLTGNQTHPNTDNSVNGVVAIKSITGISRG